MEWEMMEERYGEVLRNKGWRERIVRGWWGDGGGIPKEAGRWKNWGRWDGREKEGRGGIGKVNLGMTASDDELRPRRWSGRTAKNGKHPHALKPL